MDVTADTPPAEITTPVLPPDGSTARTVHLRVDGEDHRVPLDHRTTLLDALRDHLGNTSPKKGCDHGQCGSCTVLVDGRRELSCLTLAVAAEDRDVVTAAGLSRGDRLHPVQQAFLDADGLQCGYCTPGQVCSAVAVLDEIAAGHPSHVSPDLDGGVRLDRAEVSERMSGNLCRCGAYVGITAAVLAAGEES